MSVATRPNGTGSAAAAGGAGHDPLHLALPVRDHLGDVGQDLGRSPGRFRGIVEALGHGPRRAIDHAGAGRRESGRTFLEPLEQGVVMHGGQCRTSGVAWVSTTTNPAQQGSQT